MECFQAVMVVEWTNSERLRLLKLYKEHGTDWPNFTQQFIADYGNDRPKSFFTDKSCNLEFERILSQSCPGHVAHPDEDIAFRKDAVIDAWITHLKDLVKADADKMVELTLVEMRREAEMIEKIMRGERPPVHEMKARLAKMKEQERKRSGDHAKTERIVSAYRARFQQIFKEKREREAASSSFTEPDSFPLTISPTRPGQATLQAAFRSPSPMKSPMKSPIRNITEAIEEADAELRDFVFTEDAPSSFDPEPATASPPKTTPTKPLSPPSSSRTLRTPTRSPRKTVDPIPEKAVPQPEEDVEMKQEEDTPKEEPMDVDATASSVIEKRPDKLESPPVVRSRGRPMSAKRKREREMEKERETKEGSEASDVSLTPSVSKTRQIGAENKEETASKPRRHSTRVHPTPSLESPQEANEPKELKEKEAKETKESKETKTTTPTPSEEGRVTRRKEKEQVKEKEGKEKEKEGKDKKEKEVKEEETGKRPIRRTIAAPSTPLASSSAEPPSSSGSERSEVKETKDKDSQQFATPSGGGVASRTRHHKTSEPSVDEKKEKEEDATPKRISRHSTGRGESLPAPKIEKKEETQVAISHHPATRHSKEEKETRHAKEETSLTRPSREEKKEEREKKKEREYKEPKEEKEETTPARGPRKEKETSQAASDKSGVSTGGRREVEILTEYSIRHNLNGNAVTSKRSTRKDDKESSSTPMTPLSQSVRKSSRMSTASSSSSVAYNYKGAREWKDAECQTDRVEFSHDDEVHLSFDSRESLYHPVFYVEKPAHGVVVKTVKKEEPRRIGKAEKEEPMEEEKTPASSPSKKKDNRRDHLTIVCDVDDDTAKYLQTCPEWDAVEVKAAEPAETVPQPESATSSPAPPATKRARREDTSRRTSMAASSEDLAIKCSLLSAVREMQSHKHANIFSMPVSDKEAPGYSDTIYCPQNLWSIRADVERSQVKTPLSLRHRCTIMFMNAVMYNSTGHDINNFAVEMYNQEMVKKHNEEVEQKHLKNDRRRSAKMRLKDKAFVDDAPFVRDFSPVIKSEVGDEESVSGPTEVERATFSRSNVNHTRKRPVLPSA